MGEPSRKTPSVAALAMAQLQAERGPVLSITEYSPSITHSTWRGARPRRAAQHAADGREHQHAQADEQAHHHQHGEQHQAEQAEHQAQQRMARLAGV